MLDILPSPQKGRHLSLETEKFLIWKHGCQDATGIKISRSLIDELIIAQ